MLIHINSIITIYSTSKQEFNEFSEFEKGLTRFGQKINFDLTKKELTTGNKNAKLTIAPQTTDACNPENVLLNEILSILQNIQKKYIFYLGSEKIKNKKKLILKFTIQFCRKCHNPCVTLSECMLERCFNCME
jgi:hypothetical protein